MLSPCRNGRTASGSQARAELNPATAPTLGTIAGDGDDATPPAKRLYRRLQYRAGHLSCTNRIVWAGALLAKLQPAQRRAINHKVAIDLRRSQAQRIKAQQGPDGARGAGASVWAARPSFKKGGHIQVSGAAAAGLERIGSSIDT